MKEVDEVKFLAELPARLDAMDYEPLTDEEYNRRKSRKHWSYTNARLEGIFLTENENQLSELLLEKRVPDDLRIKIILEFSGIDHEPK